MPKEWSEEAQHNVKQTQQLTENQTGDLDTRKLAKRAPKGQ